MAWRKGFAAEFRKAIEAGERRDYKEAIGILESLAARGLADASGGKGPGHPEIYLYLARAWHAEKRYAKAVLYAQVYARLCPEDASAWFFLGRSSLADGAYDKAIEALDRSVELNPASTDARALLGVALLKGKKPSLALKAFEQALEIEPESKKLMNGYLNALFVEAARAYRRGDADMARQMFAFLVNNGMDGVAPRIYLGHSLRALGLYADALGHYMAAQEMAPDDPSLFWYPILVCLEAGDSKGAARLLAEAGAPEVEAQSSPRVLSLRIIKSLVDASKWKMAADECRAYIKVFGADCAVHAFFGEAQLNLGNSKAALNHFSIAQKLNPSSPAPYCGLLLVYSAEGNWRKIRSLLKDARAAGCDEKTISLYSILCSCYLDADAKAALSGIQGAVREYGAAPRLLLALAQAYLRAQLPDFAAGWYKKVLEMDAVTPLSAIEREEAIRGLFSVCEALDDEEAFVLAYKEISLKGDVSNPVREQCARLLAEREMWKEAAEQMEICLRLDERPSSIRQLAKLYRNAGMYRQAAIHYRKLLRSSPRDKRLLANLVYCLDRMGEKASAIALIQEVNKVLKPDASLLLIEGRLCLGAGNTEKALEVLSRAESLFPEDPRPCEEIASIYRKRKTKSLADSYQEKARELRAKEEAKKGGNGGGAKKAKAKAPAAKGGR